MQSTNYIPHREPFLFVDSFETTEGAERITGERTFTEKDFFFAGHFPGNPVVPGVILVETMAQCGGCGITASGVVPKGTLFVLASLDNVRFRRIVRPNEKFEIEVETKRVKRFFITQCGKGYVDGELAVEAEWLCRCILPNESETDA